MARAARGGGVACPECGGGLTAHLEVGIEFRLTRGDEGAYSLGAVHTHVPHIRDRALRQHGDGSDLFVDEDGIVVMCRSCPFIGTLTEDGIETEDDRRAAHAKRVSDSAAEASEL